MEELEWINAREMNRPGHYSYQPKVDDTVSKIVGKQVFLNDPRLIRLVVAYKKKFGSSMDAVTNDDYLRSTEFVKELKEVFNG